MKRSAPGFSKHAPPHRHRRTNRPLRARNRKRRSVKRKQRQSLPRAKRRRRKRRRAQRKRNRPRRHRRKVRSRSLEKLTGLRQANLPHQRKSIRSVRRRLPHRRRNWRKAGREFRHRTCRPLPHRASPRSQASPALFQFHRKKRRHSRLRNPVSRARKLLNRLRHRRRGEGSFSGRFRGRPQAKTITILRAQ